MSKFVQDVELDARLVSAGYAGGLHAMLITALRLGVKSPDEAMKRSDWLKKQPQEYIRQVARRADEMLPKEIP